MAKNTVAPFGLCRVATGTPCAAIEPWRVRCPFRHLATRPRKSPDGGAARNAGGVADAEGDAHLLFRSERLSLIVALLQ